MVINILKVAQLGTAFTQDPAISLMKFIKTNWDQPVTFTAVPKANINFDTKWARADFANHIIIEQMTVKPEDAALGRSRIRYHHYFRVQVFCKGDSALNNRYKIEQHLEDLINANPAAERGDGFDEFMLEGWQPVPSWTDEELNKVTVNTKNTTQSRSKAIIHIIYEKYPSQ